MLVPLSAVIVVLIGLSTSFIFSGFILFFKIKTLFQECDINYVLEDKKLIEKEIFSKVTFTLRAEQQKAITNIFKTDSRIW